MAYSETAEMLASYRATGVTMAWQTAHGVVMHGDCVAAMAGLPENSVDAIVTDGPYGLEFMGNEWDAPWKSGDNVKGDSAAPMHVFQRWCEWWARAAYRVLKPGGYIASFGGTRTYHRMTCGLEDAGFEIRDSLHWIYLSGFPKSLNVGSAMEKAANGATESAKKYKGFGTALKPSHEPIVLGRKPLSGTVVENVNRWGTGGINIDGCRVETAPGDEVTTHSKGVEAAKGNGIYGKFGGLDSHQTDGQALGRWPPNTLFSHVPGLKFNGSDAEEFVKGCPVAELDAQSGGASRMFPVFDGSEEQHDPVLANIAAPFRYCGKSPTREREAGCEALVKDGVKRGNTHVAVKPIGIMRWILRLVVPPGGLVIDPFLGSGTTACAAMLEGIQFVGIEREADHIEIAKARIEHWRKVAQSGMDLAAETKERVKKRTK